MIFRKARPEEAEALTLLAVRSKRSWGYDDAFMSAIAGDMVVRTECLKDEYGIVAEVDGKIAGYAILRLDQDEAYLRDLFVDPVFMGNRVGAALFERMLARAKDHTAERLWLVSDPNAVAFYQRYGLRVISEEASIFIAGRQLPVMGIDLSSALASS